MTMLGRSSGASTILFGGISVDISGLDFSNRSSRVASLKATNISLIVLVVIVVSLRMFARYKFVHNIFADDVLILIATILTVALASTCIAATTAGLGQHVWVLPIMSIIQTMKHLILYLYICQILYNCAIAMTKIAIISSYLRFISKKSFRMAMYAILAIIIAQCICGVLVTIFQCTPVETAWDFTLPNKKCINFVDFLYVQSSVNALTDLLLCFLPIPHLWRLHMPRKQRIILCILFAGGTGACVVGIVRLGFLHMLRNMDTSYQIVPSLNLTVAECSLGIICVSIPALRPIATRLFPNGLRSPLPSFLGRKRSQNEGTTLSDLPSKRSITVHTNITTVKSSSQQDLTGNAV